MSKVKSLFVTFEGIEGSGKTYQSKKLFKSLIKKKIQVVLTREPGGSKSAPLRGGLSPRGAPFDPGCASPQAQRGPGLACRRA